MLLGARQTIFGRNKLYDSEVEWVDTNGGFILTSATLKNIDNVTIRFDGALLSWSGDQVIGSFRNANEIANNYTKGFRLIANSAAPNYYLDIGYRRIRTPYLDWQLNKNIKLEMNNSNNSFCVLDGVSREIIYDQWDGYLIENAPISICACSDGSGQRARIKIRHITILQNENIVIDLIPVRITENGISKGALYDTISKKVYKCKDNVNMTYGIDKKYLGYVKDNLISMWDCIERDKTITDWSNLINSDYILECFGSGQNIEFTNNGAIITPDRNKIFVLAGENYADIITQQFNTDLGFNFTISVYARLFDRYKQSGIFGGWQGPTIGLQGFQHDQPNDDSIYTVDICGINANNLNRISIQPTQVPLNVNTLFTMVVSNSSVIAYIGETKVSEIQRTIFNILDAPFVVGQSFFDGGIIYPERILNGAIMNVSVYNRALTQEEISFNNDIHKKRFS